MSSFCILKGAEMKKKKKIIYSEVLKASIIPEKKQECLKIKIKEWNYLNQLS